MLVLGSDLDFLVSGGQVSGDPGRGEQDEGGSRSITCLEHDQQERTLHGGKQINKSAGSDALRLNSSRIRLVSQNSKMLPPSKRFKMENSITDDQKGSLPQTGT